MSRQHSCRAMYKILWRSLYWNRDKSEAKFPLNLNCDGKAVSETGPGCMRIAVYHKVHCKYYGKFSPSARLHMMRFSIQQKGWKLSETTGESVQCHKISRVCQGRTEKIPWSPCGNDGGDKSSFVWLTDEFIRPLRPRQNGRRFADDTFKRIFLNENVWILIKFSLNIVPDGPINYSPALGQIMAWRRLGDKPLSEPMMILLLTHICVTRPQWVKPKRRWKGIWCHFSTIFFAWAFVR